MRMGGGVDGGWVCVSGCVWVGVGGWVWVVWCGWVFKGGWVWVGVGEGVGGWVCVGGVGCGLMCVSGRLGVWVFVGLQVLTRCLS